MKKRQILALLILSALIIISAYYLIIPSLTGKAVTTQVTGTTKTYIYAGTLAASKSSEKPTETQYYIQDHLGSNRRVLESGEVEQTDDTYAFGETKLSTGTQENNYKFTGKPLDDETGLYYYGARYYSPELGRFIQADALKGDIQNPLELNRYAYVSNNPLKYVDPTGNSWKFKRGPGVKQGPELAKIGQQILDVLNNPQVRKIWGINPDQDIPVETTLILNHQFYDEALRGYTKSYTQISLDLMDITTQDKSKLSTHGKLIIVHEGQHRIDYFNNLLPTMSKYSEMHNPKVKVSELLNLYLELRDTEERAYNAALSYLNLIKKDLTKEEYNEELEKVKKDMEAELQNWDIWINRCREIIEKKGDIEVSTRTGEEPG